MVDFVELVVGEFFGVLCVVVVLVFGEEIFFVIVVELFYWYLKLVVDVKMSVDYVDLCDGSVDVVLCVWLFFDVSDLFVICFGMSIIGCYVSFVYVVQCGVLCMFVELAVYICIVVGSVRFVIWELCEGWDVLCVLIVFWVCVDSFVFVCVLAVRGSGIVCIVWLYVVLFVVIGELVLVLEEYWLEMVVHVVHVGFFFVVFKVCV